MIANDSAMKREIIMKDVIKETQDEQDIKTRTAVFQMLMPMAARTAIKTVTMMALMMVEDKVNDFPAIGPPIKTT